MQLIASLYVSWTLFLLYQTKKKLKSCVFLKQKKYIIRSE